MGGAGGIYARVLTALIGLAVLSLVFARPATTFTDYAQGRSNGRD